MAQGYQNFKSQPASLREFSSGELAEQLTKDEVDQVDRYQAGTSAASLITQPVPTILLASNPEGVHALMGNVTVYDDDIEAVMDEDRVVQELLELPNTNQRNPALRARRTVIALALEWGIWPQADVIDLSETVAEEVVIEADHGSAA